MTTPPFAALSDAERPVLVAIIALIATLPNPPSLNNVVQNLLDLDVALPPRARAVIANLCAGLPTLGVTESEGAGRCAAYSMSPEDRYAVGLAGARVWLQSRLAGAQEEASRVPVSPAEIRPDLAGTPVACSTCERPMRLVQAGLRSGAWSCDTCNPPTPPIA